MQHITFSKRGNTLCVRDQLPVNIKLVKRGYLRSIYSAICVKICSIIVVCSESANAAKEVPGVGRVAHGFVPLMHVRIYTSRKKGLILRIAQGIFESAERAKRQLPTRIVLDVQRWVPVILFNRTHENMDPPLFALWPIDIKIVRSILPLYQWQFFIGYINDGSPFCKLRGLKMSKCLEP